MGNSRVIVSESLVNSLSVFSRKIDILSSNNELTWNKHAESILIPLLNSIFKASFINSNTGSKKQTPAIDLYDSDNRIAIQITSTDSFPKIKGSIEKFMKNELYQNFDTLKFIFLKEKGKIVISNKQKQELKEILEDKFIFNFNDDLYDFSKLYSLSSEIDVSELEMIVSGIELELGTFSIDMIENGPVTILIFDENRDLELASKVAKGLIELDIRVRHFSRKLNDVHEEIGFDSKYCQLIFDKSIEAKSTIILGTSLLTEKIKNRMLDKNVLDSLQDQHLTHFLFKIDDQCTFTDFPWIKPSIFKYKKESFQQIIDKAHSELRKKNKVSQIQDYLDFETIIKLYDSKADFAEPIRYTKPKKKIGYTLLESVDSLKGITTYYLFIYKGVNIKQTADYFFAEHTKLKYHKNNLIVFLSKEADQKQLKDRVTHAQKNFKANKAFYLDEFVWKYCTTDSLTIKEDMKFSSNKNFIIPDLKSIEGDISDYDQIENWFFTEYDPLLVITGGGGIGKTTIAKVIADKFKEVKTNSSVIFIEASDPAVMNHLIRLSETQDIDLYDFYASSLSDDRLISKDLFRINIDNGNLLLIIDGLDEVFSRIPDFDVRNFIASVSQEFVKNIGIGKIMLTCRTYFWRERISKETHINHIEIKPFTESNARNFFKSKFGEGSKFVEKGMQMVKQLTLDQNIDSRIMPYVVDIVGKIVESGDELLEDVNSKVSYLRLNLKNDYVAFGIFVREFKKTGQISVEDQCKFFIYFSVFYKGNANSEELQSIWKSHFKKPLTSQMLEALKSHPLLQEFNNIFTFRYDFFELFFKSIYISELISIDSVETPSESLLKILVNEGKFGSNLLHEIANRCVENWDENYILRISEIIELITKKDNYFKDFNAEYLNQSISALFALALMINQAKINNQTSTNTDLLKQIFGKANGEIHKLSIIQYGNVDSNLRFNFSDLKFKECYFDGFEYFWDCTFTTSTIFENCTFLNMPIYGNNNSKEISVLNFVNPRKDLTFDEYFEWRSDLSKSSKEGVKNVLEKFFKLFYINGFLQPQKLESTIYKKYNSKMESVLPIYKLEKNLILNKLVEIEYNKIVKEKRIAISEDFKEEVLQYIKEGSMSLKIKKLVESLIK